MSWAYVHTDRVRFGDLDPMGHVNNVDFLRFFESARIAFHQRILDGHRVGQRPRGAGVVVAELHAAYREPAYFDQELRTSVRPADIGRSAYKIEFETRSDDGRLLAEGHAVLVAYDYDRNESTQLPDALREKLEAATRGETPGGGAWA
jgi:acyl-CoA thioester hydrolase